MQNERKTPKFTVDTLKVVHFYDVVEAARSLLAGLTSDPGAPAMLEECIYDALTSSDISFGDATFTLVTPQRIIELMHNITADFSDFVNVDDYDQVIKTVIEALNQLQDEQDTLIAISG